MRLTLPALVKVAGSVSTVPRRALAVQLVDEVDKYAKYCPTTLTLENFIKLATDKSPASKSFRFLKQEIPVRFANIMKEFRLLPSQLHSTPSVQTVEDWYEQSFNDIIQFKNSDPDNATVLDSFNETLAILLRRHASVVTTMADGVLEMKEAHPGLAAERNVQRCLQYFLDRFYLNRIGLRMLVSQHLMMFSKESSQDQHINHIGDIDQACDVLAIAQEAYKNARFLCEQFYLTAPECSFDCRNPYDKNSRPDEPITMTYVSSHLYHMLFELFKNSLRAVVEHYDGRQDELPKINVIICKGRRDVTIKISDQGGGIRRSQLESLFCYTYSSAPKPMAHEGTPLAGYGYGLPLSHLYARYFNGDLWLNSVDGHGTDAMICLKLHACDASEILPVYNKATQQKYRLTTEHNSDWSDPFSSRGVDSKKYTVGH